MLNVKFKLTTKINFRTSPAAKNDIFMHCNWQQTQFEILKVREQIKVIKQPTKNGQIGSRTNANTIPS